MKLRLLVIFILLCPELYAQAGYIVGSETGDFTVKKILNYSFTSSTFGQFKNRLLIIDFFGTWCVPCIKAIPHLEDLKESFSDQLNIILISEEGQEKLENFIKKRNPFKFPVIADEERKFISLFQPPSYPYTVIVGKNNRVLAIPAQEELTESNIKKWLAEQEVVFIPQERPNTPVAQNTQLINLSTLEKSQNHLVKLSQEFIYGSKTGEEITGFISRLQQLSMEDLENGLKSDNEKKAFWINLYNAFTQIALKKDSAQYQERGKFFRNKNLEIAGKKFSLDDIEHGILRRSKIKWSLGYLNKLFPGKAEKRLRVSRVDYRLHFALNCGARSCPPIAFFIAENLDQQLDIASNAYLKNEVEYDGETNMLRLPAIMGWFRRDFGGKKKMITLLQKLAIVPTDKKPRIRFKPYDWTLYLQNYKS